MVIGPFSIGGVGRLSSGDPGGASSGSPGAVTGLIISKECSVPCVPRNVCTRVESLMCDHRPV